MNKILFSSVSEEWGTPKELFEELNEEFHFVLDVCANPMRTRTVDRRRA